LANLSFDNYEDNKHQHEETAGDNREPPQVCSDVGVFHFAAERKGRSATGKSSRQGR